MSDQALTTSEVEALVSSCLTSVSNGGDAHKGGQWFALTQYAMPLAKKCERQAAEIARLKALLDTQQEPDVPSS